MSHTVFRTAQIMPINHHQSIPTTTKTLSSSSPATSFLPNYFHSCYRLPSATAKVRKSLKIRASSAVVDGDAIASLERCFSITAVVPPSDLCSSSSSSSLGPIVMKGEKGSQYGSVKPVVLEKGMPTMTLPKPVAREKSSNPGLETGGGGGDIGNFVNFGGGDGGDDDGDDDDYFDDFDDGDEGDDGGLFRRRMILPELFDRKFLEAVLNEWQKTMMDLPTGLRQAYEMGLLSSAQIVKYIAINARPTTARFISRILPEGLSRAFIGRMIADPSFLYRLLLEQAATIGCSVWWEVKTRKERIKQEWDLALINVLTVTACNSIVVWSLAPCRSYGNTFRFDLQNTLQKLPNNIFEKSYPLREFDMQKRIQSFFYKAAELCMVGLTAGAAQGALSNLAASRKEGRLSVTIPTVSSNALGYGAFLGIYANLRYQLLCGFDRAVINHFDVIGMALLLGTTLRVINTQLGETSRLAWLGVEVDPLAHSEEVLKAYQRPAKTIDDSSSSKWFISKNTIISGLGLLGIKQGQSDSSTEGQGAPPPKARRKRIVRKKVEAS